MDKDRYIEFQKLAMFCYAIGIFLFTYKSKGCYSIGYLFMVTSLISNTYFDVYKSDSNTNVSLLRYLGSIIQILTLSFLGYIYNKNEDYIHKNNISGEIRTIEKKLFWTIVYIMIAELFLINTNTNDNTLLAYSVILYIISLRLVLLTISLYSKVRYN